MKANIIARCKELGIGFRQNARRTEYQHRYILVSLRGVVAFDYLSDCADYLDLYESGTEFYLEYADE